MSKVARSLIAVSVLLVGFAVATTTPATATTRYTVYVKSSATTVPVGHTVTFSGAVTPSAAGLSIKLQRYSSGAWRGIATTTLTSTSRYAFTLTIAAAGSRSYRVVKAATSKYATGVSPVVRVVGATGFKSVSLGWGHGCALKYDKTLWCWGSDQQGQLGLGGGTTWRYDPTRIGAATWNSVSAGSWGTCGVRGDHTLWCWGSFVDVQGNTQTPIAGTSANRFAPTRIGTQTTWSSVIASATGVCAKRTNSTAACWSRDDVYTSAPNNVIPKNQLYDDWQSLWGNSWRGLGCGLRSTRQLWCFGPTPAESPTRLNASYWTMLASGYGHECGVKTDATAWCWGSNTGGATGPNPTSDVPLKFDSASWRTLAAGRDFTCGIKTAGSLWCWGSNEDGRLGAGPSAPAQSTAALRVGTASDWTSIATSFYACGTRKDGSLWCWGGIERPTDDPNQVVSHPTPVRMG